MATPDTTHATLAHWLGQQVPAANQNPRNTRHNSMIGVVPQLEFNEDKDAHS
jgi:hypothetical protein